MDFRCTFCSTQGKLKLWHVKQTWYCLHILWCISQDSANLVGKLKAAVQCHCTMKFLCTAKVLAKRMLKYSRISSCDVLGCAKLQASFGGVEWRLDAKAITPCCMYIICIYILSYHMYRYYHTQTAAKSSLAPCCFGVLCSLQHRVGFAGWKCRILIADACQMSLWFGSIVRHPLRPAVPSPTSLPCVPTMPEIPGSGP